MGCWSVYCEISNIAITVGNKCVLLPLKKSNNHEGYLPYLPATLPIFGEYDDYGGIENIERDKNTALIEKHFGVTIDEFAVLLLNGKFTYDREEAKVVDKKLQHRDEAAEWQHMWIDRQVYDFMSIHLDEHSRQHKDFGNEKMMKALGFQYIGVDKNNKSYDPKRFCYRWKHGDKMFLTDGNTLLSGDTEKSSYVFYYNNNDQYSKESSLTTYIDVPKNMQWLANKAEWQCWRYREPNKQVNELYWILGQSRYDDSYFKNAINALLLEAGKKPPKKQYKTLLSKYIKYINIFGDKVADLITLRNNLHCMSGQFKPFSLYLTPQCGEYKQHQALLNKFAEINKSYLQDE